MVMNLVPRVDVDPPNVTGIDRDSLFDTFTRFVLGHPQETAVVIVLLFLAAVWKRPLWRGILLGVLALTFVLAFVT